MDAYSRTINTKIGRHNIFRLNDVVVKNHDRVNNAVDKTIQQTLEVLNNPYAGPDASTQAILVFESIKNHYSRLLIGCIQDQDALLEVIDEQLVKEHQLLDKDEKAISQLSELKVSVQNQREANFNKFKQIQEIHIKQS